MKKSDSPGHYNRAEYLPVFNQRLQQKLGPDFHLNIYFADELNQLSPQNLLAIADCYREIYNESWGESWTIDTAMAEVQENLRVDPQRIPIATILYQENKVIGFSWGQMIDKDHLCAERDMPFDVSQEKKEEGLAVAQYWVGSVIGTKSSLFMSRELALLQRYRRELSPYLSFPLFAQALECGSEVAMSWASLSTNAYKWSLGIGFVPIHFFISGDHLLFGGSVARAVDVYAHALGLQDPSKGKRELINNINRYLIR